MCFKGGQVGNLRKKAHGQSENDMTTNHRSWRGILLAGGLLTVLGSVLAFAMFGPNNLEASGFKLWRFKQGHTPPAGVNDIEMSSEPGGAWHWMRSPEEEKRVVVGLYNRYCIRCHGVDGRGVWDIPDVPDFTNVRWQASRSDGQIVRATLEGRGACMPPFRGTVTLEETWGMARYLRTFVPGTEMPRPDRVPIVPEVKKDPGAKK